MNNPQMYVEELRKLYDCRKIGVNREGITFDCEHSVCCKAAAAKDKGRSLCRGAEAHVGEKYGDPIRIVFISLDTGGSENEYGADLLERRKDYSSGNLSWSESAHEGNDSDSKAPLRVQTRE